MSYLYFGYLILLDQHISIFFFSVGDGACAITPVKSVKPKPEKKMSSTVTKGELTLDDLPPIEQLQISVPEQDCVQIGTVSSIVDQLGKCNAKGIQKYVL